MRDTPHRTITELEDRLRRANEVIESSSPSYTLADLKRLGREYGNECQVQEDSMIEGLVMSHFVRWLAEKERQTNERHL